MAKTYIRVDDRLIHGQIIVSWCGVLNIKEIIAVDNETASNQMLRQIMQMGVPKIYKTLIITVDEANEILNTNQNHNRLIIVRSPKILPLIINNINNLDTIYLGNIQKQEDSIYNLSTGAGGVLFFSNSDIQILDNLFENGFNIIAQMVPQTSLKTYEQLRKNFK